MKQKSTSATLLIIISAITAVYKGTPLNGNSVLLRSYDSRKEPAPEFNCTIWQAGRATCATGLAFKPIQVGQSVFLDEGAGKFNPAPQILDEAVINEWPGREVGVFVSIGTGKRPPGTGHQQSQWWEGFAGGSTLNDFAEARRRLISKIEGCEETHLFMQREYLARKQVSPECYYRLNVEVGVGEFGMNEWNRLADISTSTHMYLARAEVQNFNYGIASKLSRIHRANERWRRALHNGRPESQYERPLSFEEERQQPQKPQQQQEQQQQHHQQQQQQQRQDHRQQRQSYDEQYIPQKPRYEAPPPANFAIELPAEVPYQGGHTNDQYQQTHNRTYKNSASEDDVFSILPDDPHRTSSFRQPQSTPTSPIYSPSTTQGQSPLYPAPLRPQHNYTAPHQQSRGAELDSSSDVHYANSQSQRHPSTGSYTSVYNQQSSVSSPPPPVPPKTPMPGAPLPLRTSASLRQSTSYPDADGPPPVVNMARKPDWEDGRGR